MAELLKKMGALSGIEPVHIVTALFIIFLIHDLIKYVPQWKTLRQSRKRLLYLLIYCTGILLFTSVALYVKNH